MKQIYLLMLCVLPLVSCSQGNKKETVQQQATPRVSKPEDIFSTLKFELDGKPCSAVINKQYADPKQRTKFSLSLFLTVNTLDKDKNGHPTEKESAAFYDLQTRIIKALSDEFTYCHVGTTTMTGYRDVMLYIDPRDREKAITILNRLKSENERLTSYTFEADPEWEAVASFYEAVKVKN